MKVSPRLPLSNQRERKHRNKPKNSSVREIEAVPSTLSIVRSQQILKLKKSHENSKVTSSVQKKYDHNPTLSYSLPCYPDSPVACLSPAPPSLRLAFVTEHYSPIDVGRSTYGLQLSCFVMTGPLGLDLRDGANVPPAGPPVFGMAYMSSGYGVPLAAQDYTWCLGSNMEPCYTSCRFAVRHSSEPGPLE
ncbi:hypothetical protein KUCAC02_009771, partial [Chaenocephalus aceratus]